MQEVQVVRQQDFFGPAKSQSYVKAKCSLREYSIISLFAGCGGMDLGFRGGFSFLNKYYHRHPFKITWANEINSHACRTYKANVHSEIHCGDIWSLLEFMPRQADVLIGGFPCQDISINGKGAGVNGKRSSLYRAMVEAVKMAKPRIFVAENVKGLLMKHNQDSLSIIKRDFEDCGYKLDITLYNTADFGVPQTRERVLIVGTPLDSVNFIPPVKILQPDEWITAEQALFDLENLSQNERINHVWSNANKSKDQGSRMLKPHKPGYTIRAECHGNIQFHYRLDRRISMREAARIQSFPDDFIFKSKLRETERQIGNAVPPVFAWHIANSIADYLKK